MFGYNAVWSESNGLFCLSECLAGLMLYYIFAILHKKYSKETKKIVPTKNITVNALDACIDSMSPAGKKIAKKLRIPSSIIFNLLILMIRLTC
ncbi:hypothetical protein [Shewanella salipaludis]|uniref:Uncharacterized protein n=1 Tax=Shewanella salipaludis TaxID=2723052 RepID=A0A972G945_9GAMM|nr:hypothetical protein [Shewanella salipaludis]NMH66825.1 hypothetical protein [Shewanella salipaludis]